MILKRGAQLTVMIQFQIEKGITFKLAVLLIELFLFAIIFVVNKFANVQSVGLRFIKCLFI